MPLPIGSWHLNVNGLQGGLTIETIDSKGVVDGSISAVTALGNHFFRGTWNEGTQCLTMVVVTQAGSEPPKFVPQFFRGLLFRTPMVEPPDGRDVLWTLVGSMWDTVQRGDLGVPGTARRNEFGWFAQITQVV